MILAYIWYRRSKARKHVGDAMWTAAFSLAAAILIAGAVWANSSAGAIGYRTSYEQCSEHLEAIRSDSRIVADAAALVPLTECIKDQSGMADYHDNMESSYRAAFFVLVAL